VKHAGALFVTLGFLVLAAACADRTESDAAAAAITAAPEAALERPAREGRRYWLLLGAEGWCGSHLTRFGGEPEDPGVAIVRVARFDDADSAMRAFARLDPDYLYRIFQVKMLRPPQFVLYPEPIPGDQSFAISYDARLPFELPAGTAIEGQMIAVRAGAFVTLIENIGVAPEQIVAAVGQIVEAAAQGGEAGC
jgi:hypothetical protein